MDFLVPVQRMENRRHVIDERWPPGARIVADFGTFDLDHLGAEFGQDQAGIRCSNAMADLDDHAPVERQIRTVVPAPCPAMCAVPPSTSVGISIHIL